jgi:hypothetical protein
MALPVNPPGSVTAASGSNGSLSAGAYLWAVTFYGNYGETGLGTPAGFTATAGQLASLTNIPTGPAGTVGRNIYRTKAGGTVFFYCGNIADNATTTFADLVADAGLGGAPTQFFLSQGQIQGAFVMFDDEALQATANYGLLNIGPGPWDGSTTGFFAGSAVGTGIAINLPAGHTGNFVDFQAAGTSYFSINRDGLVNASSSVASHFGGLVTSVKAGIPADSDFTAAPPNGTIVVDSTDGRAYFRYGGAWHYATLT